MGAGYGARRYKAQDSGIMANRGKSIAETFVEFTFFSTVS